MKILYFVHQFFPQHIGGTEMYVRGLAERAQERGDRVYLLTHVDGPSHAPASIRRVKFESLDVIELHSNYSRSRRPGKDEYANSEHGELIAQVLLKLKPDLVHVAHTIKLGAEGMRHCEALGIPVVVTLCDYWFLCPRHTLLRSDGQLCQGPSDINDCRRCQADTHPEKNFQLYTKRSSQFLGPMHRFLQRYDQARRLGYLRKRLLASSAIVALSQFTRHRFIEYGIPAARIQLLPHGLEELPTSPPPLPPAQMHVVFIGSLVHHKGAHVLLEALRLQPDLPLRCTLYGAIHDDDYQLSLRKIAASDSRVTFAGRFPPQNIWQILDNASVLALPSLWFENEPLVIKAALHRGIPVLASSLGSLTEQVRDGRDGWLLPPGDAIALAEALAHITSQPETWRIPPVRDLGMDTHALEVFELYARILNDAN